MKHALAIARLELREWRALPVVALAVGLAPALAWAAGVRGLGFLPVYRWLVFAGWNVAGLTAGIAMFTRDLRERRSEFLLARPLSWRAIWCGKALAALTATSAATALCLLPGWPLPVVAPGVPPEEIDSIAVTAWYVAGTLVLVGLGHWGALAHAAAGWRRMVDAVAVAALFFLGTRELERLSASGALPASPLAGALAAGVLGVSLMVAGAIQVWRGRADVRHAYAVFSVANWLTLGLAVVLLTCYAR